MTVIHQLLSNNRHGTIEPTGADMFGHSRRTRSPWLSVLVAFAWLNFGESKAAEAYDSCTGFIDSIPATITSPGNWCLRRDLSTNISSGSAIVIAANNVVLDCNDFRIGNLGAGIYTITIGVRTIGTSTHHNTTIRRCNIRGFWQGIALSGDGLLVENNRIDSGRAFGVSTQGDNGMVRNNMIVQTSSATDYHSTAYRGNASVIGNMISGVSTQSYAAPANGIIVLNPSGTQVEISNNVIRNVHASGSGTYAAAIYVQFGGAVIKNNRVFGSKVPSPTAFYGVVSASAASVICRDNVFSRVDYSTEFCTTAEENLALP